MYKNRWGSLQRSPDPLAGFNLRGLLLRGGEGREGKEGREREGEGEGRGRRGMDREGRDGKGKGAYRHFFPLRALQIICTNIQS